VLQEALDNGTVDEVVAVAGPDGIKWSRKLAQMEGIFVGISGGATLAAAIKIAEKAPEGSTMLVMLPDTGERYLSTPRFEGVEAVMTADELELMRSTPGYHFEPPKA
jgi:cysteine synthase A